VLCHYGFAVRGLHRLLISTLADNHPMIAAATRAGFVLEGTARDAAWINGRFADGVALGLLFPEWSGPASYRQDDTMDDEETRPRMSAAKPRIAVGPGPAPWAAEAIRRGGGEVVTLDDDPVGLVWTDGGAMDALREALASRPEISWVQLPQAGVERAFTAGAVDRKRRWTSAKGAYAEPVAEHALALILAGLRQLKVRALARTWGEPAGETLFGQPVTVVGAGGIAVVLLRLLEPFRAQVTVVRQHAEPLAGAQKTVTTDRLAEALASARAVVLAAALTPQTHGLIGRAELAAMRPDAWLVNVARGGVVDTEALVDALQKGQIGGAALDVTDPEPLPAGHPLWDLPNCLITPHTADTEEMTQPLLADRIAENVQRLAAGQELEGRIDPDLGY
jgi:phosphoglycerate dehydrogenase-like enzyme